MTTVDKDQLIKRLMATFLEELEEHVRAINQEALALEKEGDGPARGEPFKCLFRAAHSLKGAARSVGVGAIEDACHHLEEILGAARDGSIPAGPDLFALLFESADAIEEAGMRLREQSDLAGSPLVALLPRLDAAALLAQTAPPRPAAYASAPDQRTRAEELGREVAPPAIKAVPSESDLLAGVPLAACPPVAGLASTGGQAASGTRDDPHIDQDLDPLGRREGKALDTPTISIKSIPAIDPPHEAPAAAGGHVRVPADKLDTLLTRSGELLVARRRLEARAGELATVQELLGRWRAEWAGAAKLLGPILGAEEEDAAPGPIPRRAARSIRRVGENLVRVEKDLERFAAGLTGDGRLLMSAAGRLDEEVRRVRMLPFAEACQGLERAARDVARAGSKGVELVIEGGDVQLDRSVLEGLKDPLNHLVRNAVDHGIEPPDRRRAAGKAPAGRVTVSAALRGAQVEVVVADDGAGLDGEAIRQQARRRGLPEVPEGQDPTHLVFLPGFSTAPIITNISGRGVGLDVVKSRLEALHGTIELASEPGRGTRFTLAVPLTLTTLRALLVSAAGQAFAVASTNVHKLVRVDPADLRPVRGREMLILGGAPLPVAALADVLDLPAREPARGAGKLLALVVAAGEGRMAFVVDEFLAEQEVVVKGLGPRIRRVRNLSGATLLPSGRVALVLNAAGLIRAAQARAAGASAFRTPAGAAPVARPRLLVADDSITTRTLEKSILEAAGYDVATAVDGEAAWALLQEQGADLLVSDVEMPRMDGFELTRTVRNSPRFARLPIVLFTSRASEPDRARGIEVGADAYIVKGAFDQGDLIETIAQLL